MVDSVSSVSGVQRPATETAAESSTQDTAIGNASSRRDASAAADADFETFLSLLTAQLRNQDPLEPVDSTQFVEQLASFSAVEQQIETNTLLEQLVAAMGEADLESATRWVGRDISAPVETISFSGEPMEFSLPQGANGELDSLVVRNENGAVVFEQAIDANATAITFDGVDPEGEKLADGTYAVELRYVVDGAVTDTRAPLVQATVTQAQLGQNDGVELVLSNGARTTPDAITAIRASAAPTGASASQTADDVADETSVEALAQDALHALAGDIQD
ncbi:MAG: flagellar hook capping FlgD N-terminal domain-containing protein [Pseudomonadota bacterium]